MELRGCFFSPHTVKKTKYFCVIRSQTSTAHQAKQDGLREDVEEAWRRLESIKVSAGPQQDAESGLQCVTSDLLCP